MPSTPLWIRVADAAAAKAFYERIAPQALGTDRPERVQFLDSGGSFCWSPVNARPSTSCWRCAHETPPD